MHGERIVAIRKHVAAPVTYSDHKQLDLEIAGRFPLTEDIEFRFCAFSYSMAEPCGRSNQLIMYFMASSPVYAAELSASPISGRVRREYDGEKAI